MPQLKMGILLPVWKLMAKSPGNTIFAFAMCTSLGWAATNALYFQENGHPAPLFSTSSTPVEQTVAPIEFVPPQRTNTVTEVANQPMPTPAPAASFGPVTGNPTAFFVQSKLFELGYFKQKVDGYYGPKTAAAIREFEVENGLTATGAISDDLVSILNSGRVAVPFAAPKVTPVSNADPLLNIAQQATTDATQASSSPVPSELVAKVQAGLNSLGYDVGKVDGIQGEATATAIRKFETFYNYDQTGKITPELLDMLKAANAKF
ncbi:peptidoglycan-binding protein [Maritalea porphyrae]|uniref:peptidoglycan-binding domain-containing protein n=1 Tax=Maritalea porphyrae TaxID=880732 RepID=UPI0022AF4978|nr:peptidoglycan-binding protein [Maritalea porphyrae]